MSEAELLAKPALLTSKEGLMRCRRLLVALTGALVAIVAAVALLGAGLASAKNGQLSDTRDPRTPLDIRSLSYRLSGTNLVWTLRTYKPFSSKIFKSGPIADPAGGRHHQFIHYKFDHGDGYVRDIYLYRSHGKLVGKYHYYDPNCGHSTCLEDNEFFPVARPDSRSVKVTVPLSFITGGSSYRLAAETFFQGKQKCRKGCWDAAPNNGFLKHRLNRSQALHVHVVGPGSVTSRPDGIDCMEDQCSARFKRGTTVTLTAEPGTSSSFDGWSGACAGTNPVCTLRMDGDKTVSAAFSPTASP